jgi:hypothetical protein
MFRTIITATLGASLLSSAVFAADAAKLPYQPFPEGYRYMNPVEVRALSEAVAMGNQQVVRNHAWRMWAGIMQPSADPAWPIWYTWPNTKAAFAAAGGPAVSAVNAQASVSLIQRSRRLVGESPGATIPVNVAKVPYYPIPAPVKTAYPNATSQCVSPASPQNICDGAHFLFNGDIMIPTESLSQEGFDWIRDPRKPIYKQATLNAAHAAGEHQLVAPQRYIVTKHMYWPVKAGTLSALPVWHDYRDASYPDYAGYETWPDLVALDPSGKSVGQTVPVNYLYGVYQSDMTSRWPTVSAKAKVYGLNDFYYHQVTQADWDSFDEADKAILNASSYWANKQPFGPGDYLVTVAMHVNTREIPSWALQSVWWSDTPDKGPYAADRPSLPQAKGPWQHYLMTDSYGIPATPGGDQPVAMNPYIELVIHPVGTNCNNCHNRAGWPQGQGAGQASYQNPDCPNSLATLTPQSACLKPLTLTDFQWIIPDRAIQ